MGTLNGTNMSPAIVEDKLGQREIFRNGEQEEIAELTDRLQDWSAFKKTNVHATVRDLSGPYMTRLRANLSKGIIELKQSYPGLLQEDLEELRAEWRGELRTWEALVYGPQVMERRLKELEEYRSQIEKKRNGETEDLPSSVKKFT